MDEQKKKKALQIVLLGLAWLTLCLVCLGLTPTQYQADGTGKEYCTRRGC